MSSSRWPGAAGIAALGGAFVAVLAGCQPQPDLLCDRARIIWPYLEIDPALDTSTDDGIQIALDLRSSLIPGTVGHLFVTGEDGETVAHPQPATVDEDGYLRYQDVTVPLGRITLTLNIENECGMASSTRDFYVWDGAGFPRCNLTTDPEPADVESLRPLGVLRAEHDDDPGTPGIELGVTVNTDRPDMTVSLFALDVATGEEQDLEQPTGDDEAAEFVVTLPEGEQALRAVCHWAPGDLHPSSVTRRLLVDTREPGCSLVEPTNRVLPADDEDADTAGIQFTVLGHATGGDVEGAPALFTVDGEDVEGGALDENGFATALATMPGGPGDQVIIFRGQDRAGNTCMATETF